MIFCTFLFSNCVDDRSVCFLNVVVCQTTVVHVHTHQHYQLPVDRDWHCNHTLTCTLYQLVQFSHQLFNRIATPCLLVNFSDSTMMWPCCVSHTSFFWCHVSDMSTCGVHRTFPPTVHSNSGHDLTWLDLTWLDLTWLDLTWLDSFKKVFTRR